VWALALPENDERRKTTDDGLEATAAPKDQPTNHESRITPSSIDERQLRRIVHQTIKSVSDDLERFEFNTIVSALMELTNAMYKARAAAEGTPAWEEAVNTLLLLMAPITPHITEELWARRGLPYSIHQQTWPVYDEAAAAEDTLTVVVQVNGKVRDRIEVPPSITEDEAKAAALATAGAQRFMEGKPAKSVRYVKGRLVNIVV
jgi:leucyl-tRNA synthetase